MNSFEIIMRSSLWYYKNWNLLVFGKWENVQIFCGFYRHKKSIMTYYDTLRLFFLKRYRYNSLNILLRYYISLLHNREIECYFSVVLLKCDKILIRNYKKEVECCKQRYYQKKKNLIRNKKGISHVGCIL